MVSGKSSCEKTNIELVEGEGCWLFEMGVLLIVYVTFIVADIGFELAKRYIADPADTDKLQE